MGSRARLVSVLGWSVDDLLVRVFVSSMDTRRNCAVDDIDLTGTDPQSSAFTRSTMGFRKWLYG